MVTLPKPNPPVLMAVGAHADDIEINVGGTLEKAFQTGYEITYVMSTNNMSGRVSSLTAEGKRVVKKESCGVCETEIPIMPLRRSSEPVSKAGWISPGQESEGEFSNF